MALKQSEPVVPPRPTDRMLRDFAQIVQASMLALFQAAHVHKIMTTAPTSRDGEVGDIYLLDVAGAKKVCVKFSDGWYAVGVTQL
jgi:hypothetical protein